MVTQVDAITTPVPSRTDPANFAARGDQFLGELPTFQTQINALAAELNQIGATAESASVAIAAAEVVGNYKGKYQSGKTYAAGESVSEDGHFYISEEDDNQGNTPSESPTKWRPIITDRLGDIKYTYDNPGGNWRACDGSLADVADADDGLALALNNSQKLLQPGQLDDPASAPSGTVVGLDWSDDSAWLAAAQTTTPFLYVYQRDDETLTKVSDPASLPGVGLVSDAAIAGDGSYIAVTGSASPYVEFYKNVAGTLTKLADPSTLPTGSANCAAMSSDGTYCAVGHNTSPYVTIYKRSGDVFTKLANPSSLPATVVNAASFSLDDGVLALGVANTGTSVYDRTGDTFALFEAIANGDYGNNCSVSQDGSYIVAGEGGSSEFSVYKRGESAYVELAAPVDATDVTNIVDVAISPNGRYVLLAGTDAPYIERYAIANDLLIKLDVMDDMPSTGSRAVAISGDQNFFVLGASTSFITYKAHNYDTGTQFRMPTFATTNKDGVLVDGINAYIRVNYGGLLNPPAQWADGLIQTSNLFGNMVSPTEYGAPTDGTSPASAGIQAAIDAIASGSRSGFVWLDRPYAIDQEIIYKNGVMLMGPGAFNRRDFPNTFDAVRLYPHASLISNSAALDFARMIRIGNAGDPDNNPQSVILRGIALDGRDINGDHVEDLTGLLVLDTSDVRFMDGYIGGFDRTNNTGFGMLVEGTSEGNCFGTTIRNSVFSNSQHGLFFTGLGTTDMRISDNLFVGVTRALTLGYDDRDTENVVQQGGAGAQCVNNHYTYTGSPGPEWFIRSGGQGGSLMCSNEYYDQHGTAQPIRLGNSKAKITSCHFLCAAAQNADGLIRVMTGGSQQLVCTSNTVDCNGSAIKSLVQYSAKAGTPTGGVIHGNEVYGNPSAWLGHAVDSGSNPIADTDNGSFYKGGNVLCP